MTQAQNVKRTIAAINAQNLSDFVLLVSEQGDELGSRLLGFTP